jgi:DNA (cytosine-5)-methyltransferase 1
VPSAESPSRPSAVDLFAGAGGMSLGLEQAGFDVLAAVEYDPVHAATHKFNFPDTKIICGQVQDLCGDEIADQVGRTDPVDLVVGGPPCQGFSMIGKRSVNDSRNNLVFEFQRIVTELRARYFIMENVPGMTVGSQSQILKELIYRFKQDGYSCVEPQLLTATSFGVPQRRKRLFLVGCADGENLPGCVDPTTVESSDTAPNLSETALTPTVSDALGDLPDADSFPELLKSDTVSADLGPPSPYAALLRDPSIDPNDFSYRRNGDKGTITSSWRTVHTPESIARFAATAPGQVEATSRFLRLDPHGYSNTLRAGTDSKRGAHTSPRPIHPRYPRVITVREAARLHSMPDWFRLHSTKWHGFRQVGNAVAPLVGRAVGQSVMRALGQQPRSAPDAVLPLGNPELLTMNMSQAAEFFGVPTDVVGVRDRPS